MAAELFIHKVCPYAHRAYMVAAEKGLIASGAVKVVEVTLPTPEWYNKDINPREMVPAVRLSNGRCIPESLVVAQYLDEAFPESPSLMPKDPIDRADIRVFISDFDSAVSGLYKVLMEPDDAKRGELIEAVNADVNFIEQSLKRKSDGPFFLGTEFSLADVAVIPFVDRFRCTLREFRGFDMLAAAPRLAALMAAAEQRASFHQTAGTPEFYIQHYRKYIK